MQLVYFEVYANRLKIYPQVEMTNWLADIAPNVIAIFFCKKAPYLR